MLYGGICLSGMAYTHLHDGNVRVDAIYKHLSQRRKAIIDVVFFLLVLFPLFYLLLQTATSFALRSIATREVFAESFWYPPAYPFRTLIAVGLLLFVLQSIAKFIRDVHILIRNKRLD
jgi:TRAP-type mannitol/chloroaromatic compound transport system permease small subunit